MPFELCKKKKKQLLSSRINDGSKLTFIVLYKITFRLTFDFCFVCRKLATGSK